jgi:hypothetical protein
VRGAMLSGFVPTALRFRHSLRGHVRVHPVKVLFATLALACLMLVSSKASASPITLELKVTEPSDIGLGFTFFTSATDEWPGSLAPGGTHVGGTGNLDVLFELPDSDLSDVYFTAYGVFELSGARTPDVFVAEPATGHVSDALAWEFGPPWVSLADLTPESGLKGDLWIINGSPLDGGWLVGTWEVSVVPEPATLTLLGGGLVAAWRASRKQRGDGERA